MDGKQETRKTDVPAGGRATRVSEGKGGRKQFALHKNMHSLGFIIGTDAVAKRYHEKVMKALERQRQDSESQSGTGSLRNNESEVHELQFEDMSQLKRELRVKEAELRQVKKSYQALRRLNQRETMTERPVHETVDAEVETEEIVMKPREKPLRQSESPQHPLNSFTTESRMVPLPKFTGNVHDLAALPIFHVQRYTHRHPKQYADNPIIGYRQSNRESISETERNRRNRSLAEYGSMVLN